MMPTLSLLAGWLLDRLLGDPPSLPHPVVLFGRAIGWCERRLNHGRRRKLKGGLVAVALISLTFLATALLLRLLQPFPPLVLLVQSLLIFFCLAGTTLVREVRAVFDALDRSPDAGRRQVARIVGRDTSHLTPQEVRMAALETLAENLSDGVVAPLFWLSLLGVPGMMDYKMVNTLDSMIGYRTRRYRLFGCVAARIDDAANWIPARLTALVMYGVARAAWPRHPISLAAIRQQARHHLSPNSGWPEAALAVILDCRFGGPHVYFGELISKPFIGRNPRPLTRADLNRAIAINRATEVVCIGMVEAGMLLFGLLS